NEAVLAVATQSLLISLSSSSSLSDCCRFTEAGVEASRVTSLEPKEEEEGEGEGRNGAGRFICCISCSTWEHVVSHICMKLIIIISCIYSLVCTAEAQLA